MLLARQTQARWLPLDVHIGSGSELAHLRIFMLTMGRPVKFCAPPAGNVGRRHECTSALQPAALRMRSRIEALKQLRILLVAASAVSSCKPHWLRASCLWRLLSGPTCCSVTSPAMSGALSGPSGAIEVRQCWRARSGRPSPDTHFAECKLITGNGKSGG